MVRFVNQSRRMNLPRNILVPVELGTHAGPVLDYAVALANKLDAKLHLLHVASRPLIGSEVSIAVAESAMDDLMEQWQQQLELLAAARASAAPFGPTILRVGDPANVILEIAHELHADLLVMGTHGRRGVSRLLLGSVAESVARSSECPVLLLREGAGSV